MLLQVRKTRDVQRASRRRAGTPLVAVVGYTNSGKSSLVSALSGSPIEARDRCAAAGADAGSGSGGSGGACFSAEQQHRVQATDACGCTPAVMLAAGSARWPPCLEPASLSHLVYPAQYACRQAVREQDVGPESAPLPGCSRRRAGMCVQAV